MKPRLSTRRPLGQHFLKNNTTAEQIVDWSGIGAQDFVLEIGPGAGILTRCLRRRAAYVYAVEIDWILASRLSQDQDERFQVEQADILKFEFGRLAAISPRWKAIGNLPYGISTRILRHVIESRALLESFVFMVQKEVADRIAAMPGTKDYGYIACLAQLFGNITQGAILPRGAFVPAPRVLSRVLRLDFLEHPRHELRDRSIWETLLKRAFAQRRKTLLNNLRQDPLFAPRAAEFAGQLGLKENLRAEQVTLEQFCRLANLYAKGTGL